MGFGPAGAAGAAGVSDISAVVPVLGVGSWRGGSEAIAGDQDSLNCGDSGSDCDCDESNRSGWNSRI